MNGGKGEEGAEPHSTRGRIIAIHTSQNAGWKSSSQSKSVLTSMRLRGILLCLPEIRVFFGLGAVIAKFQGRIDCYHMRSRSLSQIPRGVSMGQIFHSQLRLRNRPDDLQPPASLSGSPGKPSFPNLAVR